MKDENEKQSFSTNNWNKKEQDKKEQDIDNRKPKEDTIGIALPMGIALGLTLGLVFNQVGLGLVFGVCGGMMFGFFIKKK